MLFLNKKKLPDDINQLFRDYLYFVRKLCCNRIDHHNQKFDQLQFVEHHHGKFLDLLSTDPKIPNKEYLIWKNDLEHGLFHGLIVGFWWFVFENPNLQYLEYGYKNYTYETILYDSLFHDFYKCIYRTETDHDKKVIKYFTNLNNKTYNHANPNKINGLVIGDRIELHRYPDANEWIVQDKLGDFFTNHYDLISEFYKILRPALQEIYSNIDEVWISHGSEDKNLMANNQNGLFEGHKVFYPEYYWMVDKTDKKYIPINMDFMPLTNCHVHTFLSDCPHWNFNKKSLPEEFCVGIMTKKKIIDLNNDIKSAPKTTIGRDHAFVYLNNPIKIEDWIFTYANKKSLNVLSNYEMAIEFNCINDFYSTIKLLLSRIESLKIR